MSMITCDSAITELVTNTDKERRCEANAGNIVNYIHRIPSVENTLNQKHVVNPKR